VSNFRQTSAWRITKRLAVDPARRTAIKVACRGRVPLTWCLGANWGDALSPVLVELLAGKPAIHLEGLHHDRYLAIGSILGGANERAEVWGSGFIRENEPILGCPRAVHAVRGPLSRESLVKQGVECPEVYGDPALLLPRFFNPGARKRYSVGIIPHYIDKGHPWLDRWRRDPQVLLLDIESGIQEFVRSVKSCEAILSSSLHGLICADAYGVPNAWVQLSDEVIGGDFKFRDYRLSIGAGEPVPIRISMDTELAAAVAKAEHRKLGIDLRKLILACPFLSDTLRCEALGAEPATGGLPEVLFSSRLAVEKALP
jgi:pyruvyltransferase